MTEVAEIIVRLTRGEGISASDAVMYAQHHIKQENEACAKIAQEMFNLPVVARAIRERVDQIKNRN